jgi:tRNA dimethylallyltransferase
MKKGVDTTLSIPSLPIVVAGPTGVGKSRLALGLAERFDGEIINYDSVQIYRGFDIGSAKPSRQERSRIPHHLFDIVDADDHFDAAAYSQVARDVATEVQGRGRVPIFVGGTFFYLRAFLAGLPDLPPRDEQLRARLRKILIEPRGRARLHRWLQRVDPATASRVDPNDRHRIERALEVYLTSGSPISTREKPTSSTPTEPRIMIALQLPREKLVSILDARVDAMYRDGLIDETRHLLQRYSYQCRPFAAIGYQEASKLLSGQINRDEAVTETKRRTRAYAKRQNTWLRAEHNVHWINAEVGAEDVFRSAVEVIQSVSRVPSNP